MFDETESILSEIEAEMIADGLFTIGPGLNKAFGHPDLPELTEQQELKYTALFDQLPYYGSLSEKNGTTFVSLAVPPLPLSWKSIQISYVHRVEPAKIPDCTATSRFQRCGQCSLSLRNDWYVEYFWTPEELIPESLDRAAEGEISSDEYSEEYRRALDQCLAEGLAASGYEVDDADAEGRHAELEEWQLLAESGR